MNLDKFVANTSFDKLLKQHNTLYNLREVSRNRQERINALQHHIKYLNAVNKGGKVQLHMPSDFVSHFLDDQDLERIWAATQITNGRSNKAGILGDMKQVFRVFSYLDFVKDPYQDDGIIIDGKKKSKAKKNSGKMEIDDNVNDNDDSSDDNDIDIGTVMQQNNNNNNNNNNNDSDDSDDDIDDSDDIQDMAGVVKDVSNIAKRNEDEEKANLDGKKKTAKVIGNETIPMSREKLDSFMSSQGMKMAGTFDQPVLSINNLMERHRAHNIAEHIVYGRISEAQAKEHDKRLVAKDGGFDDGDDGDDFGDFDGDDGRGGGGFSMSGGANFYDDATGNNNNNNNNNDNNDFGIGGFSSFGMRGGLSNTGFSSHYFDNDNNNNNNNDNSTPPPSYENKHIYIRGSTLPLKYDDTDNFSKPPKKSSDKKNKKSKESGLSDMSAMMTSSRSKSNASKKENNNDNVSEHESDQDAVDQIESDKNKTAGKVMPDKNKSNTKTKAKTKSKTKAKTKSKKKNKNNNTQKTFGSRKKRKSVVDELNESERFHQDRPSTHTKRIEVESPKTKKGKKKNEKSKMTATEHNAKIVAGKKAAERGKRMATVYSNNDNNNNDNSKMKYPTLNVAKDGEKIKNRLRTYDVEISQLEADISDLQADIENVGEDDRDDLENELEEKKLKLEDAKRKKTGFNNYVKRIKRIQDEIKELETLKDLYDKGNLQTRVNLTNANRNINFDKELRVKKNELKMVLKDYKV